MLDINSKNSDDSKTTDTGINWTMLDINIVANTPISKIGLVLIGLC